MTTNKTQDISNCLSAPFDPQNGASPGKWSLCYNQNQNQLSMSINLTPPITSIESTTLQSTIDTDGLKDMIQFLYQVNMAMQQKKDKQNT
ncbi:hypothetical protein [Gynuella sp.]|uniref:hypothetical protein n=1 Tax=Gynuella sp. TaxID=2969146 RepID=UPI003D104B50